MMIDCISTWSKDCGVVEPLVFVFVFSLSLFLKISHLKAPSPVPRDRPSPLQMQQAGTHNKEQILNIWISNSL